MEGAPVGYVNTISLQIGHFRTADEFTHPTRIGIDVVHAHVQALAGRLLETLESLPARERRAGRHDLRAARPRPARGHGRLQLPPPGGRVVDERYVDRVARRHNISLRTGCFCNPGAGEVAFTIARETLVGGEFGAGMTLDDYLRGIGLPSGGAVRASLGLAANAADLERFAAFAQEFIDLAEVPDDLPARVGC
jgi:selenocysteine lyase/cysteine desulfurase